MRIRIVCACGTVLEADVVSIGRVVACSRCGRQQAVPAMQHVANFRAFKPGKDTRLGRGADGLARLCAARGALVCALVLLALLWAAIESTGGGMGGSGRGTGTANGNGAGTGKVGDGPGAGEAGEGTGAGVPGTGNSAALTPPAASRDNGTTASAPVPTNPAPLPRPAEKFIVGFNGEKVEPPPSPPSPDSGSANAGREGASSGGSGTSNAGKDPGARGDISFTLVWTYSTNRQGRDLSGGPDIDIWVVDPKGQKLSTSREGFGLGPTPDGGGEIDHDDEGAYGKGNGGGPERVYWPKGRAPKGAYQFGVQFFDGEGSANYTVRVYIGEKLVQTKTGKLDASMKRKPVDLGDVENPP